MGCCTMVMTTQDSLSEMVVVRTREPGSLHPPSILHGQPDLGQLEGYLSLMSLHCKGHEDSHQPSVHLDSTMGIVTIVCEGSDRPRPIDTSPAPHISNGNPDVPGFGSLGSCYG